jgi:hypothetical protein
MIILRPNTEEQEFNITPREPSELSSLSLTISEDGTSTSETISPATGFLNGDWVTMACTFSILKNERLYTIEILNDGEVWWRGVARCTDQDYATFKHTLHNTADGGFTQLEADDDYQIIY